MENCIFCKIVAGEIPSVKIWEDEDFLAFLDINPVNYGHALLIPKKHHEKMEDVSEDILKKIFVKAKILMEKIKRGTEANYVTLSVVGLDVPHFHIHLIPRYFNDGLATFWPTKKYELNKDTEIAKKIKL
ncbi:MAG: HIT family protein [Nanoarchaeota archaeon]